VTRLRLEVQARLLAHSRTRKEGALGIDARDLLLEFVCRDEGDRAAGELHEGQRGVGAVEAVGATGDEAHLVVEGSCGCLDSSPIPLRASSAASTLRARASLHPTLTSTSTRARVSSPSSPVLRDFPLI
jgi:hypothetical protein